MFHRSHPLLANESKIRGCTRKNDFINYKVHEPDEDEIINYEFDRVLSNMSDMSLVTIDNSLVNAQTITTSPKISLTEGIGILGGYLGLYVGISLVTVFEFLEFLVLE